jgi:hypothetical protein
MPLLQAISLNDRETTPVAHVFTPNDSVNGVGIVKNTTGVPLGAETLTVSMRGSPNGRYRGKVNLTVPVVQTQTINGISTPVVVRTAYVSLEVTFSDKSTLQERNNVIGMLADALTPSKTLVNDALVKLEGVR